MRFRFANLLIPVLGVASLMIGRADAGDRNPTEIAAPLYSTYGQQIMDFCNRVLPDYQQIKGRLVREHPEWPAQELALNLMDIGRGQISGEADPSFHDVTFISNYVLSLNFENPDVALFTAYSGGCMMGLVVKNKLPARHFLDALKLSAHMAQITFGD
jgi:hypothetical protein